MESLTAFSINPISAHATGENSPIAEYDATVGCYKVDEYTIRYVTQAQIDFNYFLTSCTSNWLVYQELYEKHKDTTGALVTTKYGTSKETTMSYGPYKISDLQKGKQIIFAAKAERQDPVQIVRLFDLTGRVAADRHGNVLRLHAASVVGHAHKGHAAVLYFHRNAVSSRIDGIFQ